MQPRMNGAMGQTPTTTEKPLRIRYLFKGGRSGRLAATERFPRDFFYGYFDLKERGHDLALIEQKDLPFGPLATRFMRHMQWFCGRLAPGLPAALPLTTALIRHRRRLNDCDVLVATTQTYGYCLGLMKRLGLLRPRVLFIVMGTLRDDLAPRSRCLTRWLLGAVELFPISARECAALKAEYPDHPHLTYLPFGIDTDYWCAGEEEDEEKAGHLAERPYVLSIGNDLNRDYETLIKAWRPDFPKLIIVTRLAVSTDQDNIDILAGDWRENTLSDAAIRGLMRRSLFVVLPIKDTWQPSGQSACLQAMACGRTVVLSRIRGLWDDEILRDGETCSLVTPGDAQALTDAVAALLADGARADRMGEAAKATTRTSFTTARTAVGLEAAFSVYP
ncbi:MAG: glycosyltransferase family 4 protein [Rhodospirillales bacterium]